MDNKPKKVRKVKTIIKQIRFPSECDDFDEKVNEALAEGWYLVRRYTLPSYNDKMDPVLMAELQRYDDYDN